MDAAGQRRHIWAGIWTQDEGGHVSVKLEAGRTREEVASWLIEVARETPRMVIGFDFCFSYPAWFVRDEHGVTSAPEFWRRVVDDGHGERWLARGAQDRRFWGKPHKRPAEFSGEGLHRMLRATDIDCKIIAHIPEPERQARMKGITPKSVFQIGGSGSVGTASLRGFPLLLRLRDAGFRIWPFDAPQLHGSMPKPLVVEMYSRLNTGPVHKSNPTARSAYLLKKRRDNPAYAALSRTVMQRARGSEDAFDALVSTMVMAERRDTFAVLPKPRDPLHGIEGWTWAPEAC
ncbi:MAG: hypothetical protein HIU91_02050 [Acidobacteria bacterium]|nr:hypothetical protein [Acidobacteriota bacterium]